MLSSDIINDETLQCIPTKEELTQNTEHNRIKRILLYISYQLKKAVRCNKKYVMLTYWRLKNLLFKDEDVLTIRDFYANKGYNVQIHDDKKRIIIFIDDNVDIEEDIESISYIETETNDDDPIIEYDYNDGENDIVENDDPWRFR